MHIIWVHNDIVRLVNPCQLLKAEGEHMEQLGLGRVLAAHHELADIGGGVAIEIANVNGSNGDTFSLMLNHYCSKKPITTTWLTASGPSQIFFRFVVVLLLLTLLFKFSHPSEYGLLCLGVVGGHKFCQSHDLLRIRNPSH